MPMMQQQQQQQDDATDTAGAGAASTASSDGDNNSDRNGEPPDDDVGGSNGDDAEEEEDNDEDDWSSSSSSDEEEEEEGKDSNINGHDGQQRDRDGDGEGDGDDEEESIVKAQLRGWSKHVAVHLVCVLVYLIPIATYGVDKPPDRSSVLDELYITSTDNEDINGYRSNETATAEALHNIFTDDYWGRPMNSSSSHKSWRPLTVLTFRGFSQTWGNGGLRPEAKKLLARLFRRASRTKASSSSANVEGNLVLFLHRLVNVLAHAAAAELVGILAAKLWMPGVGAGASASDRNDQLRLRLVAKLIWAFHPTHVEVTANAANRPHLLAVMCSVALCDPDLPWPVFLVTLLAGYLCSETFLFQIVPAAVTIAVIQYARQYHGPHQVPRRNRSLMRQALGTLLASPNVLLRVLLLGCSAMAYYGFRLQLDWLSIPDGLIRPAENPFFHFGGWNRVRNYLYVLAIHVAKAWDFDFIGFSHEYGYECIRSVDDWADPRLLVPLAIGVLHACIFLYLAFVKQRRYSVLNVALLFYFVYLSWMATLFPISGIVKVGTFIADRIVVASTVGTTLLFSGFVANWLGIHRNPSRRRLPSQKKNRPKSSGQKGVIAGRTNRRLFVVTFILALQWRRVHNRTYDWMDSKTLLESSLRTCPRFAKAHLESSKLYSGLYPELLDLQRSRDHLEQVEEIDPNFCDVHQQFAHVAFQQHAYLEFEERLVKALQCPFTMSGAMNLWHQYWPAALNAETNPPAFVRQAQERYNKYVAELNTVIERNEAAGDSINKQESASPLIGWKRDGQIK